jgi:hypothetical protein
MSIAINLFCLIVSLTMPYAVEVSVRRGVGGCVWPSLVSVTLRGAPLWALWKHAPTSDSAAEATTFLITAATLRMDPLSVSCSGFFCLRRTDLRDGSVRWRPRGKRHPCGCAIPCRRRDIGLWRLDGLLSNITFDLWRLASSLSPWFVPLQCHSVAFKR